MSLPLFDTHEYVKTLIAAGFTKEEAEAQSKIQAEILSSLIHENLPSKNDINNIRKEVDSIKWVLGFQIGITLSTLGIVTGILMKIFTY